MPDGKDAVWRRDIVRFDRRDAAHRAGLGNSSCGHTRDRAAHVAALPRQGPAQSTASHRRRTDRVGGLGPLAAYRREPTARLQNCRRGAGNRSHCEPDRYAVALLTAVRRSVGLTEPESARRRQVHQGHRFCRIRVRRRDLTRWQGRHLCLRSRRAVRGLRGSDRRRRISKLDEGSGGI